MAIGKLCTFDTCSFKSEFASMLSDMYLHHHLDHSSLSPPQQWELCCSSVWCLTRKQRRWLKSRAGSNTSWAVGQNKFKYFFSHVFIDNLKKFRPLFLIFFKSWIPFPILVLQKKKIGPGVHAPFPLP